MILYEVITRFTSTVTHPWVHSCEIPCLLPSIWLATWMHECMYHPVLESKFSLRPRFLNTCPQRSMSVGYRTREDGRKPWASSEHPCWPLYVFPLWLMPSGSMHRSLPRCHCTLWVKDQLWACFLHGVRRAGKDEALEPEHQWLHRILLGLLVSMGSLHRQSGIRAAAGNRGVSSAFFSTLTLQRALQHVWVLLWAVGDESDHQLLKLPAEPIRCGWWSTQHLTGCFSAFFSPLSDSKGKAISTVDTQCIGMFFFSQLFIFFLFVLSNRKLWLFIFEENIRQTAEPPATLR